MINASPGDLAPVFEAMLEKAIRLCEAEFGTLRTWDGDRFHLGAAHGDPEPIEWTKRQRPFTPINGNFPLGRIVRGAEIVRITDALLASYQTSSGFGAMAAAIGFRSGIAVALRKDATLLGAISVYRKNEVRPFTDKQIALLQNFAAQAVIAMENARLLDEIRQRQEELRVTFENMGDGVAMFDETQYLAAWNRKFQDILDLPDALLGQRRTYEEHLRFLAARGDFGPGVDTVEQIEELVASTGQPYGYERTRPDGRVIEIRRNPVPDGGFVLIYSDITERKRSEEEIRAARDAAEIALRELRTAQANLIQAEKMASLGQLTAGIAHEIKNPLNFVNNFSALSTELLSSGFGRNFGSGCDRNASILSVSCRSMTNFVKMLPAAGFKRNSGRPWRRALATTSSEGGMPGRMVRSQDRRRPRRAAGRRRRGTEAVPDRRQPPG